MKNKYLYFILAILFAICVAMILNPKVVHTDVDKSGDNLTQTNESPTPTPTIQTNQVSETDLGKGTSRGNSGIFTPDRKDSHATLAPEGDVKAVSTEKPDQVSDERSDYDFSLRKANDPHYRWSAEKRCFDESNFPNQFEDRLGPEVDGYYPEWLSEVKLDNGCSFFFHPTQGRENAPIDPEESRG